MTHEGLKPTFFGRYAMPIACMVCFLFPMAIRGARISVQNMTNAVADWLPSRFEETTQMKWFWHHFVGERYIVASWEGCTGNSDDRVYQSLLTKLQPAVPPSRKLVEPDAAQRRDHDETDPHVSDHRSTSSEPPPFGIQLQRGYEFVGDQLGLMPNDDWHQNYGGRNEKWIRSIDKQWYFITPEGDLHRWSAHQSPWAQLFGHGWRKLVGAKVEGPLISELGPVDGPWYYADPHRLRAQLFQQVTTGPQIVQALTAHQDAALPGNEAAARRRLAGLLLGPDGQQTCLVLTLSDVGRRDLHAVIGRSVLGSHQGQLYSLAESCGLPPEQLHLAGPPVDNVAIDEEGTVTLVRLVALSGLLGVALTYICFRSVVATLIVFIVGGVSAICSLAMVGWLGSHLDAILMAMPALIYVLAISGAVHLMNYYQDALDKNGPRGAVEAAIAHGWTPALLCNVTTAVGLFSLITGDLVPIRKFGLFSGLAVLATIILLFSLLPAALELCPLKRRTAGIQRQGHQVAGQSVNNFWTSFGAFMIRRHLLVSTLCIAVIVTVGWGSRYLLTSVNFLNMFDANAKIIRDYAWLESKLGKLIPLEVVVKVPTAWQQSNSAKQNESLPGASQRPLSFLDRMLLVEQIQSVVERELGPQGRNVVGSSMSAATMALPSKSEFRSLAGRVATNLRLTKSRSALLESDYLKLDEAQSELWRISFRIAADAKADYGQIVEQLKRAVGPIISAYRIRDQLTAALLSDRSSGSKRVLLLLNPPSDNRHSLHSVGSLQGLLDDEITKERQSEILAIMLRELLRSSRLDVAVRRATSFTDYEKTADDHVDALVLLGDHLDDDLRPAAHDCLLIDARVGQATSGYIDRAFSDEHQSLQVVYTGIVPVVYKAQQTLLSSLIKSSFWSFVTITPLMMIVCRSFSGGLVVMLPNVLPIFVVFGFMGWMQVPIDIGSMMSASIALGVAVDDTIHFLAWFRVALHELGDRQQAILSAFQHCATPTLQAALISGLGLSIFSFSTFVPIKRFGVLMLAILLAGVAAELIFLPALLAGPLGKVFQPRKPPPVDQLPDVAVLDA